jgi:hypothetical protein
MRLLEVTVSHTLPLTGERKQRNMPPSIVAVLVSPKKVLGPRMPHEGQNHRII